MSIKSILLYSSGDKKEISAIYFSRYRCICPLYGKKGNNHLIYLIFNLFQV